METHADNPAESALGLYCEAQAHAKAGRLDEALAAIEQSLSFEETAPALHDAGVLHYMKGDRAGAITYLKEATINDPGHHQAYGNLARILFEAGQVNDAIEYACVAVITGPDVQPYKEDFIRIVKGRGFTAFYPRLREALVVCLGTDGLMHQDLRIPWMTTLMHDPALLPLRTLMGHKSYKAFRKSFLMMRDLAPLFDPLPALGLKRLFLIDHDMELFLTHLRHFMLDAHADGTFHKFGEDGPALAEALAIQCFGTDFIFGLDDDERKKTEILRHDVETGVHSDPVSLCILGAYVPLSSLANAHTLARMEPATLIRLQIREPLEERTIRAAIPALTSIDDSVSAAVRAQYEEFPYPRWTFIDPAVSLHGPGRQPAEADRVLIAGCGTGLDAAIYATALPQARVTAVDLSLSSLSYAIRATRERGLTNIDFYQADILKLEFDQPFDLINSTGVLHHMHEPEAGWSILTRLLKPGGLMCIALYSEQAREAVVAARAVIARKGIKADREGIRYFRARMEKFIPKTYVEILRGWHDFYSMPECRDLLFHVQESRFTLPQIEAMIERQGLIFMGFNLPPEHMNGYRAAYPDDAQGLNLKNWAAFEKRHPDLFTGMYHFWCRKPA